jgi:hypothetical protein
MQLYPAGTEESLYYQPLTRVRNYSFNPLACAGQQPLIQTFRFSLCWSLTL